MKRSLFSHWALTTTPALLMLGLVGTSSQLAYGQAYAPRPKTGKATARATDQSPDQNIRLVAGEEPIRQPAGPAPAAPRGNVKGPAAPAGAVKNAGQRPPVGANGPIQNGAAPIGPVQPGAAGQVPGGPPPVAPAPQAPAWVAKLSAEHVKYVDEVLGFWEAKSDSIEQYKCEFKRFEYDPIFGPKDTATPKSISTGVIQYGKPDKGLFKVSETKNYVAPLKVGGDPTWEVEEEAVGEHWVCDGKKIFEFDPRTKRVIERALPVAMQGKAITDGPLPFLFGAKAAQIKARYWVRAVTPEKVTGQYWLEAHPKGREDAGNFSKVTIIIDEKEFLPHAICVFAPNAAKGGGRVEYEFTNREVYGKKSTLQMGIANLNVFQREFFEPKVPFGWKKVVDNTLLGNAEEAPNNAPQANRPENPKSGKLPR